MVMHKALQATADVLELLGSQSSAASTSREGVFALQILSSSRRSGKVAYNTEQ